MEEDEVDSTAAYHTRLKMPDAARTPVAHHPEPKIARKLLFEIRGGQTPSLKLVTNMARGVVVRDYHHILSLAIYVEQIATFKSQWPSFVKLAYEPLLISGVAQYT